MKTIHTIGDVTWINLENPTQQEAREIIEENDIDMQLADEIISPTLRPKVDVHDDYLYLVLHFPSATSPNVDEAHVKNLQEVDFIIKEKTIITISYSPLDEIQEFEKVFEVNKVLQKSRLGEHAGFTFFYLIQLFYKHMLNRVEAIRDYMSETERNIFLGQERQMVEEISRINRILLTFQEALSSHHTVLTSFEIAGKRIFDDNFSYYLRSIVGEYRRVLRDVDNAKEYLRDLRDTNDSLVSTKQNEVMKTLTVMAFVILPLSLVASVFGMNAVHMPFIGQENDFLTIVLLMVGLTVAMFIYFRSKKWL